MIVTAEYIPVVSLALCTICTTLVWLFRYHMAEHEQRATLQADRDYWRQSTVVLIEPTRPRPRSTSQQRVAGSDTALSVYASGKDGGTGSGTAWLIKSGAASRLRITDIPPVLQGSRWVNAIVVSEARPENTGIGITATRKAYRAPALPSAPRTTRAARIAPPAPRSNPALSNPLEW